MGFFDKVKQALNIGGVSVKMQIGPDIARSSGKADGTLTITSKSPQHVKSVKVRFERTITIQKPVSQQVAGQPTTDSRIDILGNFESNEAFDIQPGETKTFPFTLTFNLPESVNEQLAQVGGIIGAIGGLSNTLDQSQTEYRIYANLDVDKAAFDATDTVNIRVV